MNMWTVLKSIFMISLHDRCEFFSSLKDECICEKNYLHAVDV